MALLRHLAARETWHCHPDQLDGTPYHPYMLVDAMALQQWILENSMSV